MAAKPKTPAPLVVEVAINGFVTQDVNPHVPITSAEMMTDIMACIEAGATIVHAHAGAPVFGADKIHESQPYIEAFRPVAKRYPQVLLYPTLSGGPVLSIEQRYRHIDELFKAGLLKLAPIDPGTMNFGSIYPDRDECFILETTYSDIRASFEYCTLNRIGCTMSIFEPGFLQVVLAHARQGTLPPGSMVKLEFSAGRWLFGLKPNRAGIDAYLSMLEEHPLPWFVNLRQGDLGGEFGQMAIKLGAHVRVGIEDYGGPRTPRNPELVAEIVEIGRRLGRRPARLDEVSGLLGIPQ